MKLDVILSDFGVETSVHTTYSAYFNTYRHLPLAKQLKKYVDPIRKHNVKWLQDHFPHS